MFCSTLIKIAVLISTVSQAFLIPGKRGFGDALVSANSTNITGLIYTNGNYSMNVTNSSTMNTTVYGSFINTTNITLPELSNITWQFNETASSSNLTDLVITVSNSSLESAGFYYSMAFPNQTVVVTNNSTLGLYVANSAKSFGRGGLIVDNNGIIYSGVLYPHSVLGAVAPDGKVTYYFDAALPSLVKFAANFFMNHSAAGIIGNMTNETQVPIINPPTKDKKGKKQPSIKVPSSGINVVNISTAMEIAEYVGNASNSSWTILASNNLTYIPPHIGPANSTVVGAGLLSPIQASVLAFFATAAGAGFFLPAINALG